MTEKTATSLALSAILVAAFVLRYIAVDFGFPVFVHPDESQVAAPAARIAATGDLDPETFLYPSLYIYMQSSMFVLTFLVERLTGGAETFEQIELTTLYHWGRLLTVFISVATIYLTFVVTRILTGGPSAGLLAALLVGASFLHMTNSFTITTDVPMGFWVLLSAFGSLLIVERGPALRYYMLAAVSAGLAGGTKYNAVFCVLPLVVAHFSAAAPRGKRPHGLLAAGIAVTGLAFLASTPYVLIEPASFFEFLRFQRTAYAVSHAGAESATTSFSYYAAVLLEQFGIVPLLASVAGALALAKSSPRAAAVTITFPAAYFLFMGSYRVHFERNMVPVLPFLAALAGLGCIRFLEAARRQGAGPSRSVVRLGVWAVVALLTVSIYHQGVMSLAHAKRITLPNTRWISKQWIETNLPSGSKIAVEFYTPPIDPERFEVTELGLFGLSRDVDLEGYDYLVASSQDFRRFLLRPDLYPVKAQRYKELFGRHRLVKFFRPEEGESYGPAIRVYATD